MSSLKQSLINCLKKALDNSFCSHDWELTDKIKMYTYSFTPEDYLGVKRVYICKKCLKTKTIKTY